MKSEAEIHPAAAVLNISSVGSITDRIGCLPDGHRRGMFWVVNEDKGGRERKGFFGVYLFICCWVLVRRSGHFYYLSNPVSNRSHTGNI